MVDVQKYSRINKGFNYTLTSINNILKYTLGTPLNKTEEQLTEAFEKLFEGYIPQKQVDRGTEFYNSSARNLLDRKLIIRIQHFLRKRRQSVNVEVVH